MRTIPSQQAANPILIFWITAGLVGFFVLPWYGIEDFFTFEWLIDGYPFNEDYAPAAFLIGQGEKLWLTPLILPLLAPFAVLNHYRLASVGFAM